MAAKPKMVTCTCGNTELDRINVRLPMSNGESLALVALRCAGNGCGRVTFRPDEAPKDEAAKTEQSIETPAESITTPPPAPTRNPTPKIIASLFERVYKERLVYKVIAERDPNCPHLFEALKSNPQVCAGITDAFGRVYQRIDTNEDDLLAALQTLPALAAE